MQIFNADGSEVEACGNGARAVAAYLARQGIPEPVIETLGGTLQAQMPANQVPVNNVNFPGIIMPTPRRAGKTFRWQKRWRTRRKSRCIPICHRPLWSMWATRMR